MASTPQSEVRPTQAYKKLGIDGRARKQYPWETAMRKAEQAKASERKRNDSWQIKALRACGQGPPTKTHAAKAAGVALSTLNRALADDEGFTAAWGEAFQAARDGVFEVMWKLGVTGQREAIYWNGEVAGYRRVIDSKMTVEIARAMDPETFDPRVRAVRTQARALTDINTRRSEMLGNFADRFAEFDAKRAKLLNAGIVDVEMNGLDLNDATDAPDDSDDD